MSKQPLSPLSSIMPAKGEAARVEVLPDKAPPPAFAREEKPARDGLTIRIKASSNARLRTMAFQEGQSKQALLDRAIDEFLDHTGY